MNSSKKPDRGLAEDSVLNLLREDIASGLIPGNAFEQRLLDLVAHAIRRLQHMTALQQALADSATPFDLLEDIDRVKTVQRLVSDAERSVQHALDNFYRAQRNRKAEAKQADVKQAPVNVKKQSLLATRAPATSETEASGDTPASLLMAVSASKMESSVPMPDH